MMIKNNRCMTQIHQKSPSNWYFCVSHAMSHVTNLIMRYSVDFFMKIILNMHVIYSSVDPHCLQCGLLKNKLHSKTSWHSWKSYKPHENRLFLCSFIRWTRWYYSRGLSDFECLVHDNFCIAGWYLTDFTRPIFLRLQPSQVHSHTKQALHPFAESVDHFTELWIDRIVAWSRYISLTFLYGKSLRLNNEAQAGWNWKWWYHWRFWMVWEIEHLASAVRT